MNLEINIILTFLKHNSCCSLHC